MALTAPYVPAAPDPRSGEQEAARSAASGPYGFGCLPRVIRPVRAGFGAYPSELRNRGYQGRASSRVGAVADMATRPTETTDRPRKHDPPAPPAPEQDRARGGAGPISR